MLLAKRAVALVAALFGFCVFATNQNLFASFGAVLLAGCALMVAFPSIAQWLAGEGVVAERDQTLRCGIAACTVLAAICVAFLALAPHWCGGSVDSLFRDCIPASETVALTR